MSCSQQSMQVGMKKEFEKVDQGRVLDALGKESKRFSSLESGSANKAKGLTKARLLTITLMSHGT